MDESSIIPAEKVAGAEKKELQGLLKTAVQSVDWTYSVFWQFCPQQRLVSYLYSSFISHNTTIISISVYIM